jgi:c-di-GMP-related signal transduction protein
LTDAQKKYTTLEKELLSIFMTFTDYATMLLGAQRIIHTDHKNLTYNMSSVNEQFGPKYEHISGEDNFLAGMFSHLDRLLDQDHDSTKRKSPVKNFSFLIDDHE